MARVLALDVGDKRIGLAVSDELGISAHPLITIKRRPGRAADARAIADVVEEFAISRVVVGVPINMNGSEGEQAAKARDFAVQIQQKLKVPVETWDERLTTAQAESILIEAGKSRARRKEIVDQVSAVLILESYLAAKGSKS